MKNLRMAQIIAKNVVKGTIAVVGVGGVGLALSLERTVRADLAVHVPKYPWSHNGIGQSIDTASARRGYQVYKQVCAACHSNVYLAFRHLSGVTHTPEQVKAEAETFMIQDGPNDKGEMFMRKGKVADYYPSPYPNKEAARVANGGAFPPDLSLMARARHGTEDYIFSLLIGYCDPPAGVTVQEGLTYNPYFPGKQLAMPPPLYNEAVVYKDGTPATKSQMAKDVSTFLTWTADKNFDDRKRLQIKCAMLWPLLAIPIMFKYNHIFSYYKSQTRVYSTFGNKYWNSSK